MTTWPHSDGQTGSFAPNVDTNTAAACPTDYINVLTATGRPPSQPEQSCTTAMSAVLLSGQIGVTYKTAWSMLRRIRSAMGQRDAAHILSGVVELDDAYFGGPKVGGKRGPGYRDFHSAFTG